MTTAIALIVADLTSIYATGKRIFAGMRDNRAGRAIYRLVRRIASAELCRRITKAEFSTDHWLAA